MSNQIKYQAIWGKLYILLGILFSLLFLFGAYILNDYSILFNLAASAIVIYLGNSMLKRPYAAYSSQEIKVFGFAGTVRKHYEFLQPSDIIIRNDKLYLGSKQLKLNRWMIDKQDWQRMILFFSPEDEAIMDELVD